MKRTILTALVALSGYVGLAADPVHPFIDFSLYAPHMTLLGTVARIDGVQVKAFVLNAAGQWVSPKAAHLITRSAPASNGIGICSPQDMAGGTCGGEIDEAGQREMLRIAKPRRQRITAVWLSSMTGHTDGRLDDARIGISDLPDPGLNAIHITWYHELTAGDSEFNGKLEARVPLYLDGACATYVWVQARAGVPGNSNMLVWGVDTTPHPW